VTRLKLPDPAFLSTVTPAAAAGIITNGLLLHLDAGNTASYPGTGTTWTDLSGKGTNGTFGTGSSAPSYNSSDGGSIAFDGGDHVSVSNTNLIHRTANWTYAFWVMFNATPTWYTLCENGSWTDSLLIRPQYNLQIGVYAMGDTSMGEFSFVPTLNIWYHHCFVRNGNFVEWYRNGSYVSSLAFSKDIQPSSNLFIGKSQHSGSQALNGRIAVVAIYDRALSASEVTQNHDALKSRYGL
jgi:hypothetical protein